MTHRINQAADLLRNLHPDLAVASTVKSIALLLKQYVDAHGYADTNASPEGRVVDAIDDMLMALDESGHWPAAAKDAPTIQTTAWGC